MVINCCFDGRHFTCGCAAEHPHERKECGRMKTMVDVNNKMELWRCAEPCCLGCSCCLRRGMRAHVVGDEGFDLLRAGSRLICQQKCRDEIKIVLAEILLRACVQEHTHSKDSRLVLADTAAATCDLDTHFRFSFDLLLSTWRGKPQHFVD